MKQEHAFETARIAIQHLEAKGWKFRNGADVHAAMCALIWSDIDLAANAMEAALIEYRLPDYDLRCCG